MARKLENTLATMKQRPEKFLVPRGGEEDKTVETKTEIGDHCTCRERIQVIDETLRRLQETLQLYNLRMQIVARLRK